MGKIFCGLQEKKPELKMKVVWNTCERGLGRMKSVKKNNYKRLILKLSKANTFQRNLCNMFYKNSGYSLEYSTA